MEQLDLFGNPIIEKGNLKTKYGANPFTILYGTNGDWQNRKRRWIKDLGIKSEIGRDAKAFHIGNWSGLTTQSKTDTSVFDPVLCELMYKWFCKDNGSILDPFAGGSVRGIVANYLGYKYTGIDIRREQIESNIEQANKVFLKEQMPEWIVGDSNKVLDDIDNKYDMVFTCPPYVNLEIYSDIKGDISNLNYSDFIFQLESILRKCCKLLNNDGSLVIVVGEVRDKNGNYYGFVPDVIKILQRCDGMKYYNEGIFATSLGTACFRADNNMIRDKSKLVRTHQNIIMFKKE